MAWPLPSPADLAERAAGDLEAAFAGEPIDARAPESVFGVLTRITAGAVYEAVLFQRALADELFVDTAIDTLERHADVWGVTRLAAVAAGGLVRFQANNGTTIPAGTELRTAGGLAFMTQASVTVTSGGVVDAQVRATTAGAAGTLAAGTVLQLSSVFIVGLTFIGATVLAPGLTAPAGRDRETDEQLRARLLRHIRERPRGGAAADYDAWARAVPGVAHVNVVGDWVGRGSVGVVIGMAGGVVPSPGDVAAVAAAIAPLRPVTAEVHVVAMELVSLDPVIEIEPDTAEVRAAVLAALALWEATEARIGQTVYLSRLSEVISAANGEYAHRFFGLSDLVCTASQFPVIGGASFGGYGEF